MSTLSIIRLTLIVTICTLLLACATSGMTRMERAEAYNQFISTEKLEDVKQISAFRFEDWRPLGSQHLLVSTGINQDYLILLINSCLNLDSTQGLIIHNNGINLRSVLDSISATDFPDIKCHIRAIYKLTHEQKKTIMKIGRKEK